MSTKAIVKRLLLVLVLALIIVGFYCLEAWENQRWERHIIDQTKREIRENQ